MGLLDEIVVVEDTTELDPVMAFVALLGFVETEELRIARLSTVLLGLANAGANDVVT